MKKETIFVDENNNKYKFSMGGEIITIYAECYISAVRKLENIVGKVTIK